MSGKFLRKLIFSTIVIVFLNALIFQVSLAVPGSVTTLFAHDGRQFHGNMFDVTVINPLRINSFDVNIGLGNTTVTVYYRNGSYVGSETNPGAWMVLGSANVSGAGQNTRTSVLVSSPVLSPGTYGFYITVTPTFELGQSVDMYYTSGGRTVATGDISITAGNGVGGLFGDPAACAHWSRDYPNNPCIFPDRSWNGTIYYDTVVAPTITSLAPANGTVGVSYFHSYSANGNTPINYSLTGGALPPGLTLSGAGVVSGTPTTAGTYSGTVTASNGTAPDAAQAFNISIVAPTVAPTITSAAPANGTIGTAYNHSYTASGTSPINYVVTAGALPPGLTLSGAGVVSGTPTTAGTYSGTVTASNGTAPDATQAFNISIVAPTVAPTITSAAPANGTVGTAYNHSYTASGTSPINYVVTAGALPPGLTLSGAGVVSGTPTTAGTYSGTVTASNGTAPDATQAFNISIVAPTVAPTITSAAPANGTVGTAYNHSYTASGTSPINYVVTAGALPPGLTLSGAGVVSGTPTTAGTYSGTVTASNGTAPDATQAFNISIVAPTVAPTITSAAPANGTVGTAYNHSYTASGTSPISYVVTAGALPPGLTLSGAGVVSGTPTTAGTYSGTVTASNGTAPDATQAFNIIIVSSTNAPTITSPTPGSGTVGVGYNHTFTANGTTPISYAVTGGALPPGLTLSSAGIVSGTPTTAGTYSGTVTANNGTAPNATQAFSITITPAYTGTGITTLFAHDDRQFHGNMFDVTVINALSISSFDVNLTWGSTTVTIYYRNGSYIGSETNPAAWTVLGSATVVSQGPNNRTPVPVSSPVLQPGTYGFYVSVTPTFQIGQTPDLYYSVGGRTVSNADISITTGNGVGGAFGDPAACAHWSRNYPNNPCVFPDRSWNGTIYYQTVNLTAPTITSATPGNGTVGTAYNHTYTATGTPTITYTRTSGTLPPGLTLSSAGVLSGTPTTAGTYSGTVTASNGTAPDATQAFNIIIVSSTNAPTITSPTPGSGTVGVGYNHTFTANGTTPISYAVTGGALPPGLTLSSAGIVSGTPTTAGTYSGTVTANNGTAPNATQAFSITITPAYTGTGITTLFAHDDRQFHGNMFDVTVINALSISSFDVNLTWGSTTVTIYYRNGSYIGSETNPAAWTVLGSATVVSQGPNNRTPVPVSSPVLQPGTYGFYVSVTPTFQIGQTPDLYYSVGGRTVSNADISITTGNGVGGAFGDPAACAHWSRNYPNNPCVFPDRSWNGTIYYQTVNLTAPTITSATPGNGTVGTAYNHTYTATGTPTITYTRTSGTLPPGLTLSSAGVLSGTPTTAGTYSGTVTASNGTAPNATQTFNITILTTAISPSITSAAPGNGTIGTAYNHSYTASGTTPISYAVTGGALPPGLTLSSAGIVSGTPTTAGTYSGTVTANNGTAPNATQAFNITIASAGIAPAITSAPLGNGTVGIAYNHTYSASGTSPISYAVTGGALPPGLTLSGAGVVSGTPTTAGTYSGTVTASNGTAPNDTQTFNIIIASATNAPTITSVNPGTGTVGVGYNHTFTANGTTPISYAVTGGALPPGLTLSGAGVVSGTPTTAGAYSATVTASNGTAPNATQAFTITITPPYTGPGITTLFSHDSRQFHGNMFDVTVINALSISSFDVNLTWGSTTVTIYYRNGSYIGSETNPAAWTVLGSATVVSQGPNNRTPVPVSSPVLQPGTYGFYVSVTPTFQIGQTPDLYYSVGGRTVSNADISITTGSSLGGAFGDPAACAHWSRNYPNNPCVFPDRSWNGTIYYQTVNLTAPTITSAAPANGTRNVAYTHSFTATGTPTITYTRTSGTLPPGLTLSSAGVLSGTPTTAGTYTATVTASNGTTPNATQTFTIVIASGAPTITSAAPGNGTIGTAYTHTFTATGTPTITYTRTSGTLPPGLTLSSAGVLSGTPTTAGTYTATVTASNGTTPNATQTFTIVITPVAPTITSAAPANGTRNVAYTHSFTATGTPTITYTRTSGTLPPGLTLSSAGVLSGTPTTAGTYTATVTASNGTTPNATQTFTIVITSVAPTITSAVPANGTRTVTYTHTFTANGTPTITYSRTSGTLPPGLTLSSAGVLSGTPTTAGTYTATVTASNGTTPNATQTFTIVIASGAPTITSAVPGNGTIGTAYTHTFTASGITPITYTRTSGTLPPGLTLSSAGVLSGTPTTAGTYTATVTASNGTTPNATQTFTIVITPVAPTITSAAPANGTRNVAYTHTFTATGTPTITYSRTSGTLPTGLTLSSAGVLSGTPTTAGTYTATVTASNGTTPNATQTFTIVITSVAPTITSAAPGNGSIGTAYTHTFTATGTPTITYSRTSGTLPTGLTLSSAGVLSGTPTTAGTYTATVTASNGTTPNATQTFTIVITSVAPTITSAVPANGTRTVTYTHTFTANGTPTITYTRTSGTLPPGLTLSSAGVLSGTPTTAGTYTATVTASNGTTPNATQTFTIVIASGAPTITSAAPANGRRNVAYTHTFTATGITPITYTRTSGTLPTGLTLSSAGVLSGTPTRTGNYTVTVTASNGTSPNATQTFTITITS